MVSTNTSSQAHLSSDFGFSKRYFENHIEGISASFLASFRQITRHYALFHILFFTLGLVELLAFVLFFSLLTKSTVFAFTIAGLFFTGFAYFVLLFYLQVKKPQQLLELRNDFIEQCKTALPYENSECEYHMAQAQALFYLLGQLHRQEYNYYTLSSSFQTFSHLTKKFSAWTHWKDVHTIKEILLQKILKKHVKLVQLKPTDLEIHAGLATTLISLSRLYMDPRKSAPEEEHLWVSPDYHSEEMNEKFKRTALRAIEELRILDAYAPKDPWVHSQMAAIYQDLDMIDEEIKEYETILSLVPQDQNILQRLGILYFSQGRNAQGLNLYEKLNALNSSKAEKLLSYYGAAFIDEDQFEEEES